MYTKKNNMKTGILMISLLMTCSAKSQIRDTTIVTPNQVSWTAELIVPELEIPWGMAFLPDGSMLITEIKGTLIHFRNGVKTEIKNVPKVATRGQGGFLDVVLHPEYDKNGWIYFTYSSSDGKESGTNTALMRAKLNNGSLEQQEVLYKAEPNTSRAYHYGSRIVFDKKGYLYFTIGDRGDHFTNPQDLTKDGGKVYRLTDDGTVPEDNPFTEPPFKKGIYSYGHRNQQGMVVHPETGEIWAHEHGPQGGDEINIVRKGINYGWPVISYGINYDNTILTDKTEMVGMEQPLYYYIPSIAPSGMAFVYSDKFPEWRGNLLIGSLKFQYLERIVLNEEQKVTYREKILADVGRVRDVRIGPDGYIYAAVEGKGIYKITPKK
jgi:glucose/arabinose dehydrogenase